MIAMEIADIARIGLLFMDGDALARALNKPAWIDSDDIDFNHDAFNAIKQVLLRIERIAPAERLLGVVWTRRPDDGEACEAIVLGSKHAWGPEPFVWPPSPMPFWEVMPMFDALRAALDGCQGAHISYAGAESWFFPIRDSNEKIAGALELRRTRPDEGGQAHPEIG